MADIAYSDWFNFVLRHLPTSGSNRLAELFSGPGRLASLAERNGYEVVRLDNSRPALGQSGMRIVADATALPLAAGLFAGLLAVNGSINYLVDDGALAVHFNQCHAALCDGGVYILDFCPAERAHGLHGRSFAALDGKVTFSHRFSPADQELLSAVKIHSGPDVITEIHRQRIYTVKEIRAAAQATGFEIREEAENYGLPYNGQNAPMVAVALRKA